jgi:hypothetical protein
MNYPQIKPTLNLDFSNTKTLDPRINFRRGTPGAYYDGKTYAKAEENLISYSEDFSNAYWDKIEASVTENAETAPDGNITADKIIASTDSSRFHTVRLFSNQPNLISGKEYTFSCFLKKGGYDFAGLQVYKNGGSSVSDFHFDLNNGVHLKTSHALYNATSGLSVNTVDILSVGNDWYRCVVTVTPDLTGEYQFRIYIRNDSVDPIATFAGDGTSGIYAWGAQLEQRDSVTAYTPTNGNPITKYQPQLMFASSDQPRFDHDPLTGESKGLLIEESRTNRFKNSIPGTVWSIINVGSVTKNTSTANYSIAPDGTNTATRWQWNIGSTTSDRSILRQTIDSLEAGTIVTLSIYLKSNTGSNQLVALHADGSIYSESVVTVTTEWQRFRYTYTAASGATNNGVEVKGGDSSSPHGSQLTEQGDILIWGAQLEVGSFPTSYIKTSGASATRSADNASITGENFSSWYRQDEGSFEIDASLLSVSQSQTGRFITISDGSTNNRIQIDNNNTTLNFYIGKNGSDQAFSQWNRESVLDYKFAFALKENDVAFCKNNESIFSDSSVNLFFANKLDIKKENNDSEQLNGHIKKLSYYPQRLTNEQLQQLTK